MTEPRRLPWRLDLVGNRMRGMESGWSITTESGLSAFYKQRSGPSIPGTDWLIVLRRGSDERRILVRTYAGSSLNGTPEQAQRALNYVAALLRDGWNPDD